MRMRGFVAGGLIGLAAGIILSRRKPDSVDSFVRRAEHMMNGAKHKMIEQMLNRRFGEENREGKPQSGKSDSGSSWNTIQSMINADARVKQEAERILSEAGDAASDQDKPH